MLESVTSPPASFSSLPSELTRRVLWFVHKKYDGRSLGSGRRDLKNCRLVCREWNEVGAPFLFDKLYISACFGQLNIVEEVSSHSLFSKGVKELLYDVSRFERDCLNWSGYDSEGFQWAHVQFCKYCTRSKLVKFKKGNVLEVDETETSPAYYLKPHMKLYQQLYRDQERIWTEGLDYECIKSALKQLPSLERIRHSYRLVERWREDLVPQHPALVPATGIDETDTYRVLLDIHRSLDHLLQAMAETSNHISSFQVDLVPQLLGLIQEMPGSLAHLHKAFESLKELSLDLHLLWTDLQWLDRDSNPIVTSTYSEIIPERNIIRGPVGDGMLARLLTAAPRLTQLTLSLNNDGQRGAAEGFVFNIPFAQYIGNTTWPNLRTIYLGGFDMRERDLVDFITKHKGLQDIYFDRLTLIKGHWTAISNVVEKTLSWRTINHHRLKQIDPARLTREEEKTSSLFPLFSSGTFNAHQWRAAAGV